MHPAKTGRAAPIPWLARILHTGLIQSVGEAPDTRTGGLLANYGRMGPGFASPSDTL